MEAAEVKQFILDAPNFLKGALPDETRAIVEGWEKHSEVLREWHGHINPEDVLRRKQYDLSHASDAATVARLSAEIESLRPVALDLRHPTRVTAIGRIKDSASKNVSELFKPFILKALSICEDGIRTLDALEEVFYRDFGVAAAKSGALSKPIHDCAWKLKQCAEIMHITGQNTQPVTPPILPMILGWFVTSIANNEPDVSDPLANIRERATKPTIEQSKAWLERDNKMMQAALARKAKEEQALKEIRLTFKPWKPLAVSQPATATTRANQSQRQTQKVSVPLDTQQTEKIQMVYRPTAEARGDLGDDELPCPIPSYLTRIPGRQLKT